MALLVQMDGVRARAALRENPWGRGMSTDQFYDAVLAATGDKKEAERKAKARRNAYIKAGIEDC